MSEVHVASGEAPAPSSDARVASSDARVASRGRRVLIGEARALAAALTFLTRAPLGRRLVIDGRDMARAGPGFPLVGAAIGAATGGVAVALSGSLSALLAVALALVVQALLTGALHLDALADTADALGASSRERALEIMRDHAIGAYGATALALAVLVRAASLGALVGHGRLVAVTVLAGALSRGVPVLLAATLPYARPGPGAGASLTQGGTARAALAGGLALAIAVGLLGLDGAILAGCALTAAILLGLGLRRWLGGVTGDTLGAAVELSELIVLVVAVGLRGAG